MKSNKVGKCIAIKSEKYYNMYNERDNLGKITIWPVMARESIYLMQYGDYMPNRKP